MKVRDKILAETLVAFNKLGIDNVSTYDIAKKLKIRQSHITYYFPTQLNLINALTKKMVDEVNENLKPIMVSPDSFSFKTFYDLVEGAMKVHQKYKFIFLNYANIITNDKELNTYFKDILFNIRPLEFDGLISLLEKNGYLNDKEHLIGNNKANMFVGNILAIYWIQESAIYHADKSEEAQRKHHLQVFFQTYIPYLTAKGKRQLKQLFK